MTSDQPTPLRVDSATERDRPVLEQLWTMFRHDMSAYSRALPDRDGRFRQERLDASLRDPEWRGYLFRLGSAPVGFAVVRGIATRERVLSSFFLVQGARRAGRGTEAVRFILHRHPGAWAVAYQDANTVAAAFWHKVAAHADPRWTLEHTGVPGRPDLPADTWVRFEVG